MNRDCNGDFFVADGVRYYRCLADSTVMSAPEQGVECPRCHRSIDGSDAGEFKVRTARLAVSPGGSEFELPVQIGRVGGFYWVKQDGEWLVGQYSREFGGWSLPADDRVHTDMEFESINDSPLQSPQI